MIIFYVYKSLNFLILLSLDEPETYNDISECIDKCSEYKKNPPPWMLDKKGSLNIYGQGYFDGMCQYKCYTKFNLKLVI